MAINTNSADSFVVYNFFIFSPSDKVGFASDIPHLLFDI